MRIGLVTDFYYPWIAGPSILLRNLGHGLAVRGHTVSLLGPSPAGPASERDEGPMRVTRIRTLPSPFGYDLRVAPPVGGDVGRWLDAVDPDIIHVHHPFPLSARAIFAARRRGIPVVATNHTIPECSLWGIRHREPAYALTHAALARWIVFLLGRCEAVATPTATAATALRDLGYSRPIRIISNGVDTARFCPGRADPLLFRRLGLSHDIPIILYTGRLDAEKDMGTWLDAAAMVLAKANAQFVIGGNGADKARLEVRARDLGITESVRFTGYLADDEFVDLYRLAQIYCITSPVELQSIATLEAMASGLPIVGVSAGALPELVRDGETGYCVAAGDPPAVAHAILELLTDEDKRRSMGETSRTVADQHDLKQSVDAYERFLESAVSQRRGEQLRERAATVGI